MQAMLRILRIEWRLQWREPVSLLFIVAFPALMVALNGEPETISSPINVIMMLSLGPLMLGLMVLPTTVVGYRERGMLRRLQMTPLPPLLYLLVQVIVGLLLTLLGSIIALVTAAVMFDLSLPNQPQWLLLGFLLGTLAMIAVGALVASVVPSTRIAQFVSIVIAGGLMLTMLTQPDSGSLLSTVSQWLPARSMARLIMLAWTGGSSSEITLLSAVLLGTTAICLLIAARLFRWE